MQARIVILHDFHARAIGPRGGFAQQRLICKADTLDTDFVTSLLATCENT